MVDRRSSNRCGRSGLREADIDEVLCGLGAANRAASHFPPISDPSASRGVDARMARVDRGRNTVTLRQIKSRSDQIGWRRVKLF